VITHVRTVCAPAIQACETTFRPAALQQQQSSSSSSSSSSSNTALAVDLLGSGLWQPLLGAIATKLPSIFATGLADTLHANYTLSQGLLLRLVTAAYSNDNSSSSSSSSSSVDAAVARLRAHSATREFHARWNLPVYYQLRFREISQALEEGLAAAAVAVTDTKTAQNNMFGVTATASAWECVQLCWQQDVFLLPLAHHFVKLTLQILGRYEAWTDSYAHAEAPEACAMAAADLSALRHCVTSQLCVMMSAQLNAASSSSSSSTTLAAAAAAAAAQQQQQQIAMIAQQRQQQQQQLWRRRATGVPVLQRLGREPLMMSLHAALLCCRL
jgi:hypothetical protein